VPNAEVAVVDIFAIVVDKAVVIDVRDGVIIVARRPVCRWQLHASFKDLARVHMQKLY
jgi:hypothetical protein